LWKIQEFYDAKTSIINLWSWEIQGYMLYPKHVEFTETEFKLNKNSAFSAVFKCTVAGSCPVWPTGAMVEQVMRCPIPLWMEIKRCVLVL
jgi:hypothetical protein